MLCLKRSFGGLRRSEWPRLDVQWIAGPDVHRVRKVDTGYLHPMYAASFGEFGRPRHLRNSGGWVIERSVPGSDRRDAMGTYPLFLCHDWSRIAEDLAELRGEIVSVALVTDPLSEVDLTSLKEAFDIAVAYKEHYVVDLQRRPEEALSGKRRYDVRRALRHVQVVINENPLEHLEEWVELYEGLCRRRAIKGIRAYSREAFRLQFTVPGFHLLRVLRNGRAVGAKTFYLDQERDVAYGHVAAYSEEGYSYGASYAAMRCAIEYLASRARWFHIGASAGLTQSNNAGGLERYKRIWTKETRTAYFCGHILDSDAYGDLCRGRGAAAESGYYFPAYRIGEMG